MKDKFKQEPVVVKEGDLFNKIAVYGIIICAYTVLISILCGCSPNAEAGPREYFERIFTPEELERISTEEAMAFEQLFNEEVQAIHDDLIEDAEFHAEQIDCLIKAVYFEAAKEPALGKRWVYGVIHNRLKNAYRGKRTYCDVIYDYKQFSFANLTKDRVPDNNRFLTESRNIVLELYGNAGYKDITCGATHYLNVELSTDLSWYNEAVAGNSSEGLTILAKVGNHTFLGPEDGCN